MNAQAMERISVAKSFARRSCSCKPHQQGFTLTELITIMVIIGILAAVAVPRFFDSNTFQERASADQVKAALRYAQKVAIAQHRNVSVTISAAASADCTATLVAGSVACVVSSSVAGLPALPVTYTFDAQGRPAAGANLIIGSTTLTIEAETGYVH